MLNIGRKQKLVVVKKVEFGIYLGETREAGEKERVLLPIKQVPEGTKEGDELEVFLYRDSSDRLIATTREPKLVLGELAVLNVAATGKIGAFLDWGLEKDLFLPFKQQTRRLHPGDEVLVSLYIDKSDRLCATMKVYHFLKTNSPYVVGDTVKGRIYEISGNFGVFVAVDDRHIRLHALMAGICANFFFDFSVVGSADSAARNLSAALQKSKRTENSPCPHAEKRTSRSQSMQRAFFL